MTQQTPPYTDALAARLAEHLYTHQWRSDPEFPLLHKPSAHREHNYNSDCAICQGNLSRIARAALDALAAAGRLLPDGGKEQTEHEIDWRHRDRELDNPTMTYQDFTEQQVDQEIASADQLGYEPREVRRRAILTWPDGATFTGAWETR